MHHRSNDQGGLCPGKISVLGFLCSGGLCPGRRVSVHGVSVREVSVQEGICLGGLCPEGSRFRGDLCQGDTPPRERLPCPDNIFAKLREGNVLSLICLSFCSPLTGLKVGSCLSSEMPSFNCTCLSVSYEPLDAGIFYPLPLQYLGQVQV